MTNTVIQLKKSGTPSNVPSSLSNGELALNYADGKLFYKAANGTILAISGSGGGANSFGTVNVNGTLVVADIPGGILTVVPGNNIIVVGDAVNDKITVGLTNDINITNLATFKGEVMLDNAAGAGGSAEGGEIHFAIPTANTTLSGPIAIDIYQNKMRFFETSGSNRGAFIDLTAASGGVGSDLLSGGGGTTDTTARVAAGSAFDKANSANIVASSAYGKANAALSNTSGITFGGTLNISANLVADRVASSNNGLGENFKVGDDAWIGDINVADTLRIKGQQNSSNGFIVFGDNNSIALGRTGSNNLTYGGNTVWHAGNDGTGSGLDADLLDGLDSTYFSTAAGSAFDKANSANVLAYNTGIGANAYAASVGTGANTVGIAAFAAENVTRAIAVAAYTQANAVGTGANTYLLATIAGANTAVGSAANTFATATIAGANTAVGTGANTVGIAAFAAENVTRSIASAAFAAENVTRAIAVAAYGNANSKFSSSGGTINGDVSVSGNLYVTGNTIWTNVSSFVVNDSLIYLASNNYTSDIVDIGFVANYMNATGSNVHTGVFRDAGSKEYYIFEGYNQEPYNNVIDPTANGFTISMLNASLRSSNILLNGTNVFSWITAAYTQANTSGSGSNNYIISIIAGANTAVGSAANTFATATIAGANTAVGAGANAYAASVGTGANTVGSAAFAAENVTRAIAVAAYTQANAVGTGANAYATAVGTAGNTYAASVGVGANTYLLATIAGANTAVGGGANAFSTAASTGSNAFATAVGTAGNTYMLATLAGANTAVGGGANTVGVEAFAAANIAIANVNYVNTAMQAAFATANSAGGGGIAAAYNQANTANSNAANASNIAIAAFSAANSAGGGGGSVNVQLSYTWTNNHIFTDADASTNNKTGAIVVTGGVGVTGNVYTASKIGWANPTSNVSAAYTYYNSVTNSLDTVFG